MSKEETLSRAQQAAASRVQYGEATHGVPGAFNFEDDNDDFKTGTKNKKLGYRATNSGSGKTLAEDIYSVAGNTSLPIYQEGEDEVDNFASSTCSVAEENTTNAGGGGKPPDEFRTPKRRRQHCARPFGNDICRQRWTQFGG